MLQVKILVLGLDHRVSRCVELLVSLRKDIERVSEFAYLPPVRLRSHLEERQTNNEQVLDSLATTLFDQLSGASCRSTRGDEVTESQRKRRDSVCDVDWLNRISWTHSTTRTV